MSRREDVMSAEIGRTILLAAAEKAKLHFIEEVDRLNAKLAGQMAAYNAKSWWYRQCNEAPNGGGWGSPLVYDISDARDWRDRCIVLIRLASSTDLSSIRLPEKDLKLLRPWLAPPEA